MTRPGLAKRPCWYTVGIAVLPIGTLGFLAGFVSPYWHFSRSDSGTTRVHGLWLICDQDSGTLTNCEPTLDHAAGWLRGAQFLEVMALLLLPLACIFAVLINFKRSHVYNRLLQFFAGFGSIMAIFGWLCYLLLTLSDSSLETYNWAFGISVTGSIISSIAAIIIAVNTPPSGPKEDEDRRTLSLNKAARVVKLLWLRPSQRARTARSTAPRHADQFQDKKTWLLPSEKYWLSNV